MASTLKPACFLCGAADQRILMPLRGRDGNPYHAVRCPACGVVYAYPQPGLLAASESDAEKADAIGSLYDEDYYASNWGGEGLGYRDEAKIASMLEESNRQREAIAKITGLATGRILDIGCADGRYLAGFQRAGWEVTGVEVSPVAAAWAREQFQVPVLEGTLDTIDLPERHFDLVRLKHCIEHLPDPRGALNHAYRVLRPGGFVIIDTDNADGLRSRVEIAFNRLFGPLAARIVRLLMHKDLTGRYGRLTPPIHLFTFNPSSMSRLLSSCKFETLECFTVAHGDCVWFPLISRFRGHPLEVLFRLVDWLGWKSLNRGEAMVIVGMRSLERA